MTKPYTLTRGDVLAVLRTLPDNSFDSIVTDPPYELGFMGRAWDRSGIANNPEMWAEAMRVLKPGGHLLAFSGSRTYHRMACAIEDGGFEIRDQIMYVYGSGFPKSLNVSKAIESGGGRPEDIRRMQQGEAYEPSGRGRVNYDHGAASAMDGKPVAWSPTTDAARQWEGWGTALKPAHEPICVARKPLAKGCTVAANVLQFGTGAINIDGCRIGDEATTRATMKVMSSRGAAGDSYANQDHRYADRSSSYPTGSDAGRWPANLIHDGSDEVVALFPRSKSCSTPSSAKPEGAIFGGARSQGAIYPGEDGSAARFFYCAKASRTDRNEGTEHLPQKKGGMVSNTSGQHMTRRDDGYEAPLSGNTHPTVKPTDLMAYLCRLVTPPGGKVLDLFFGSGSTGKACMREGFEFYGIDQDKDENGEPAGYLEIADARISFELARVLAAHAAAVIAAIPPPQLALF